MKIKEIKLYGFKSFPEDTRVTLNAGITAFVGPNGSGKSNIFDALRWVFGEQSMKALRCEKIEDLIYLSSDAMNDAHFTEVSITIDNEDYFPQFGGEFEIKRKFYRSGESEFFLNRVKCRLLDIQALFLNSGTLTYSFLELSEIEKIIHGDTKQMFDDVSGILKYQERREQTRRRLEATEQDLLRLEDIIHEMQRSLRSLRRQVRQAKLFQELRSEFRMLSLILLKSEYDRACGDLMGIQEDITKQEAERQAALQSVKQLQQERERLKGEVSGIEGRKRDTLIHVQAIGGEIEAIEQCIEEKEQQAEQIILSNERTITSIKEKDELIQSSQDRLAGYTGQESELEKQIAELKSEMDGASRRIDELNQKYFVLKGALTENNRKITEYAAAGQEYTQEITRLELDKENKEALLARIDDEHASRKEELDTIGHNELKLKEELDAIVLDQESLSRQLKEDQEKLAGLEKSAGELELDLRKRQEALSECKIIVDTLGRRIKEKSGLKEIKDHFDKRHKGLLRDNLKVKDGYESIIDVCLGDILNYYVITESKEEDFLKIPDGRFGFIRLDHETSDDGHTRPEGCVSVDTLVECKAHHEKLKRIIACYYLMDSFSEARSMAEQYPACGFVTRDGILFRHNTVIIEQGEVGYFRISQKLEEQKRERETINNEIIFIEEERKRHAGEVDAINVLIESRKEEIFAINVKKSEVSLKLNEISRSKERIVKEYDGLKSDRETLLHDIAHLNERIAVLQGEISHRQEEHARLEGERQDLAAQLETNEQDIEENNSAFGDKKMALVALEERYRSCRANIDQLKQQVENLHLDIETLKKDTAAKALQEVQDGISALQADLESKKKEKTALEQQLPEPALEKLTRQLNEIFDQLDTHQRSQEEIQNRIMELKYKSFEITHTKDDSYGKARDEFKIDLRDFSPEEEITEPESRLAEVKGKLEKLGEVNPLSLELYEKEKQRLDEFLTQRDDIITAKKNLLRSIDELDLRARERFVNTFMQVKKEFNYVFANFFEGGEADLVLNEPENPLTSKIDIVVRMKGKRVKKINQLSGGERTLLAISLLLAFYLVKPAPFCILDEIDAPLDDANVVRFNKFLRDLSQRTQVVIITHNRATMEYADYLYGLTMEKPGQSKIISARLADLEKIDVNA